jgi:hypothetical protein
LGCPFGQGKPCPYKDMENIYMASQQMKTISILVLLISAFTFITSCGDNPIETPTSDEVVKTKTNPATGSIRGKIVPPIAGTVITAYKESQFVKFTEADDQGNYLISDLSPGIYAVEISAPFHFLDVSNRSVEVVEGQISEATTVFLRSLEDAAVLSGRIIDAKTKAPLADIRVKVECVSRICAGLSVSTNKDGIFETKLWPDLDSNLVIDINGYSKKEIKVKPLGVKGKLQLEVELEPKSK